jgi:glycosyltransferase involved in cell wall biosynthesis
MRKIEFIIPTYNSPDKVMTILNSLMVQNNPNWTAHVVIDGQTLIYQKVKDYFMDEERIKFSHIEGPHNDWGHTARQYGLANATQYWNVMTGDDNYYMPTFVNEFLFTSKGNINFVFCDMVHNNYNYQPVKSDIKLGKIDIGNFMSITEEAKSIQLNTKDYNADFTWIHQYLTKVGMNRIMKIDKVLYVHN